MQSLPNPWDCMIWSTNHSSLLPTILSAARLIQFLCLRIAAASGLDLHRWLLRFGFPACNGRCEPHARVCCIRQNDRFEVSLKAPTPTFQLSESMLFLALSPCLQFCERNTLIKILALAEENCSSCFPPHQRLWHFGFSRSGLNYSSTGQRWQANFPNC